MPSPTPKDVHVDRMLTNVAVAYIQDAKSYVADQVFPSVPVAKQSDRYFVFSKGDLLRDEAQERAPGTESAGGGVSIDNTPNYYAKKYAYHEDVSDDLAANADSPLSPYNDSSENVTQKLLTKKEILFASGFMATGKWDTQWQGKSSSPSTNEFLQWDAADSDPIKNVTDANEAIRTLTGYKGNILVLGPKVYNVIANHAKTLDRIKYTQKGIVTPELLSPMFGVDRVLIASAVYNTAKEGAAAVMADIVGKVALLVYAAPAPSIRRPSGGYTFTWTGLLGANNANGIRVKRFRMEELESDRVEGEMAFDQKLIGSDLGAFLYDAIS